MKTLKLFVAIRACYPWDEVKSILFRKPVGGINLVHT